MVIDFEAGNTMDAVFEQNGFTRVTRVKTTGNPHNGYTRCHALLILFVFFVVFKYLVFIIASRIQKVLFLWNFLLNSRIKKGVVCRAKDVSEMDWMNE